MIKHSSIKPLNQNRLPSLHKSHSKVALKQDIQIPKLLFEQKTLPQFQDYPKNIEETKAQNFLNQTMTLSSPSVVFNLSNCVKKQYGKKFQNSKEFSEQSLIKSNFSKYFVPQKQNQPSKSMHIEGPTQNTSYLNNRNISFERKELLNLAKWIDQKLQEFNLKKSISVNEIIDYKQHIINYGLGKIVDSVRKKSKQEGDLLQILWQNSFRIFQKVLQIVSNSICQNQKSHIDEQKQSKQIFDMNLSFLTNENLKINAQLNNLYEKMKKIIIWNKKLRKQKQNLNVQNRILQYRNQTYSQALEETVGMFLKSVPQPSTLNFSKKIIEKLARQKRRKKRTSERKQIEEDFKLQTKELVMSWLRRNGFSELQDDQIDPSIYLTNDQKLELTRIDDDNKIKQIDIYEYFKLLDIGVQTQKQTKDSQCQYDIQTKPKTSTRGVLTDALFKKNFEVQVSINQIATSNDKVLKKTQNIKGNSKILRKGDKLKSNASKFSEKSDKVKDISQPKKDNKQGSAKGFSDEQEISKFSKIKTRTDGKESIKTYSRRDIEKQSSNNRFVNLSKKSIKDEEKESKFYEREITIISEKKSEDFNFDSDEEVKNWSVADQYRVSISKLNDNSNKINKYEVSKNENYGSVKGRQVSMKDFTEMGLQDELTSGQRGENNIRKVWKLIQNKKMKEGEAKDSRRSMNFIKSQNENYSMKKLQKKVFNDVYEEQDINARSKQKQREKLFETVVRRRSFYKKGKVTFQNAKDFEENKQTKANLYKSYIHYKPHKNKTLIEIAEQEEEKVDQISKMMSIPSNLAKAKTFEASKQIFKQLSQTCKRTKKQPPKNKQYFNSSLVSIAKNVNSLVQDYIRQIKREKEDIQTDFEKSYYPLHTILMDKMNWKYGLKDISEKKIKDFLQKILTFAPVSQKVGLYSLLFGMDAEGVGADQLLIYLRSLVYFEKKQTINSSIHILKETNIFEKVLTDREIVQENIDKLIKEFFDKEGFEIAKKEVLYYLEQNQKIVSVEKISEILIRCLLKRKQLFRKDCKFLYRLSNRGNNIFTNLYKILKIYNNYSYQLRDDQKSSEKKKLNKMHPQKIEINIPVILKQFVKRSDVVDEIYGKSISFDRFLIAFMVSELPKSSQLEKIFNFVVSIFGEKYGELNGFKKSAIRAPKQNIKIYCQENIKFLEDIQKRWQVKSNQKPQEETWQWSVTKTVTQHIETNLKGVLGKLDIINNQIEKFFFSLQNNSQSPQLNIKQ